MSFVLYVYGCVCVYVCVNVCKLDKLRIQGRMHFFGEMSQSALNHVLILQKYRTQQMLQIPLTIIDLQHDLNILIVKQWTNIISAPMS